VEDPRLEIVVHPRRSYWYGYAVILLGALLFAIMALGLLRNLSVLKGVAPRDVRAIAGVLWKAIAGVLVAWAVRWDRRMLYWRLDGSVLTRGLGPDPLAIPHGEIGKRPRPYLGSHTDSLGFDLRDDGDLHCSDAAKVVPPDTYTPEETKALASARLGSVIG
jgi:hypothetical protein